MTQDRTAVAQPDARSGGDIGEADESVEPRPAVDETVIEQLATITDGQGFSVLGELLNAFLSAVPGRLETLDRATSSGESRRWPRNVHVTPYSFSRPKMRRSIRPDYVLALSSSGTSPSGS